MSFVKAIFNLVESVASSPSDAADVKGFVLSCESRLPNVPRVSSSEDETLLRTMLMALVDKVEGLYGPADASNEICFQPVLNKVDRSQICYGDGHYGVAVGRFATTWEQIFYQLAHESVHLLNPVMNAANKDISTLEEGVAVKFAEQIYSEYITSYTQAPPRFSPLDRKRNAYHTAFLATRKIPDDVLKNVRERFGKFSAIDDKEQFRTLVEQYISADEVAVLQSRFEY